MDGDQTAVCYSLYPRFRPSAFSTSATWQHRMPRTPQKPHASKCLRLTFESPTCINRDHNRLPTITRPMADNAGPNQRKRARQACLACVSSHIPIFLFYSEDFYRIANSCFHRMQDESNVMSLRGSHARTAWLPMYLAKRENLDVESIRGPQRSGNLLVALLR
jgi:hypothetical protein